MNPALAVAGSGWLAGAALGCRLPLLPAAASSPASVSVVVPARDEERNLPRLLDSLAAQTLVPVEVIVVDDGSTDATAAVATERGARVVVTEGPPPGWTGKTWACHLGVAEARGSVLVLLDADTWLAPDGIARLVAALALDPGGLVSVQPFHVTERAYEQASALANVVPVLASGMAAAVRPRSSRVAFGPCLVTAPSALAAVGGFGAVRHDAVEDVALAGAYRAAGRTVRCYAGATTVRFRMYPGGARSLVHGWAKNLTGGARRAPLVPALGATLWVAGAGAAALGPLWSPSPVAAFAYLAFAVQLAVLLHRVGSFRWWAWAVLPVSFLVFVALFACSVVARSVRRDVVWRGRWIAVGGRGG